MWITDRWLQLAELSKMFGLSKESIKRMVKSHDFPLRRITPYAKPGVLESLGHGTAPLEILHALFQPLSISQQVLGFLLLGFVEFSHRFLLSFSFSLPRV